jgi:hypothetical protein
LRGILLRGGARACLCAPSILIRTSVSGRARERGCCVCCWWLAPRNFRRRRRLVAAGRGSGVLSGRVVPAARRRSAHGGGDDGICVWLGTAEAGRCVELGTFQARVVRASWPLAAPRDPGKCHGSAWQCLQSVVWACRQRWMERLDCWVAGRLLDAWPRRLMAPRRLTLPVMEKHDIHATHMKKPCMLFVAGLWPPGVCCGVGALLPDLHPPAAPLGPG